MRHFAALVVLALPLFSSGNLAVAQNGETAGSGQNSDQFTYTLVLNDEMIETLKQGEPLISIIPPELRNRVTEVKLRYEPPPALDRTARQTQPSAPANSTMPGNTGQGNSGFQPNANGNRTDSHPSNQFGDPPSRGTSDGSSGQNPNFGTAPSSSQPHFGNSGQVGSSNPYGQANSDGMVPTTPRNTGIRQHEQPLGPPNPYWNANANSYESQAPTDPSTPNESWQNRFQSQQPASSQPHSSSNQFQPNSSTQPTRTTPGTPTRSNEFDTRQPYQQWNAQPGNHGPTTAATPSSDNRYQPPAQNGMTPNRYSNQMASYQQSPANDSYHQRQQPGMIDLPRNAQPRQTPVAGHDVPGTNEYDPRLASRRGYAPSHAQSGYGNDLTATIPGQATDRNGNNARGAQGSPDNGHEESVGANSNPDGRTSVAQLTQFNGFLWFLLLCSIGLNIYLGWISRGFYVRYRGLADELRDSFSTV